MSRVSKKELDEWQEFIIKIANRAGKKLIRFQKGIKTLKVSAKEAQGVVSRADIETEQFIIREIKRRFPDHYILGEESSFASMHSMSEYKTAVEQSEFSWIIDPLDGTTNFLTGLDYFAVCIALYHCGELQLSVVHRPQTSETYSAIKGKGAWKIVAGRRRRIKGPTPKKLADSVLATGFSSEKGKLLNDEFARFKRMMASSRGIRRMGSAALDMCLLAEGIFNGFWERGLAPWDIAASGLICMEAGIHLQDWQGRDFSPFIKTILGVEPSLLKEFSQILGKC